jgi:L-asparagine transporter-like permease
MLYVLTLMPMLVKHFPNASFKQRILNVVWIVALINVESPLLFCHLRNRDQRKYVFHYWFGFLRHEIIRFFLLGSFLRLNLFSKAYRA